VVERGELWIDPLGGAAGLMEGPAHSTVEPSLVIDRLGWIRVPGPVQRGQPDGALASAVVRSVRSSARAGR
jgi:hypothetical protein